MKQLFILLLLITFWFKGSILYWCEVQKEIFDGIIYTVSTPYNFLELQLNHSNPPDANKDPIEYIIVEKEVVKIMTKDKYWILHYEGHEDDWYVEDWRKLK